MKADSEETAEPTTEAVEEETENTSALSDTDAAEETAEESDTAENETSAEESAASTGDDVSLQESHGGVSTAAKALLGISGGLLLLLVIFKIAAYKK